MYCIINKTYIDKYHTYIPIYIYIYIYIYLLSVATFSSTRVLHRRDDNPQHVARPTPWKRICLLQLWINKPESSQNINNHCRLLKYVYTYMHVCICICVVLLLQLACRISKAYIILQILISALKGFLRHIRI